MDFAPRTDPALIDDLRSRLRATRWPEPFESPGWNLGADTEYLRDLAQYWAEGFDWPAREDELNRLPRSFVEVGGTGIHVVHSVVNREEGAAPAPALLLAHGWPDSFWRYLKVIPLLAGEFDLVIPDMPGYGYSDKPVGPPLDSRAVAALWAQLMSRLGYERFFVAGGDIGSGVVRFLALDFPERVVAMHSMGAQPVPGTDASQLTPEEQAWLRRSQEWAFAEGAYAAMHRTKPDTAAAGLLDSPVGLAAWIVEKLRSWSERGLESYTQDEILTNLSIYWFTRTIGSSMRMYNANSLVPADQLARRVEVPSGFSIFPADMVRPPREWLERSTNLAYFSEPPAGGHFAPFEVPELYAQELRTFFAPYL
ncbi:epoxide hydrolase [Gryllotalpicola daejeonensis]|uniref:Epoxide hydrolase n=1 Tax=Gryllotalpicola daejeonensis TaxID=993087 RepID=A0ABP7ZGS8_9MICO